jgi:hypothetical protein
MLTSSLVRRRAISSPTANSAVLRANVAIVTPLFIVGYYFYNFMMFVRASIQAD